MWKNRKDRWKGARHYHREHGFPGERKENRIQIIKKISSFLMILILLPYVITVFWNGTNIRKWNQDEKQYVLVNTDGKEKQVLWEEYLIGVLADTIPRTYEKEAIAAQAVILRTVLQRELAEKGFASEAYITAKELKGKATAGNYEKMYQKYKSAVEETSDLVLLYQDQYANAAYHRSNTGSTRDSKEVLGTEEYPYLCAVSCPEDKRADEAMNISTFSYEETMKNCRSFLAAVEKEQAEKIFSFDDFEIVKQDSAGYVTELRMGENTYPGEEFRTAMGLPSCAFTLQDYKGELRITTVGNGHGFGMSQWSANVMAKDGASYAEILQCFYPGTEVKTRE
ncbi:SpoIID/LytB domain-containing protein [Hespellia stercorisuis]|uniref:Stage II sporulation protein D n=1 Tax=Hespellia stercorisuis DSM 15480 TaxID=1121950 RepID=A0A1M6P4J1_9FIRM|nr:SpoIID/LytB domain-containing protein [Hespellia stercorisuis]SHK02851.1 stage II sporulation protein D [Hespellia stercorisuis DSM 15480]